MDYQLNFTLTYVLSYLLCAAFCVLIYMRVNNEVGRELEARFLKFMLVALVLYCVFESLWAVGVFGYSAILDRLGVLLSIINHIMIMAICFYWFCYVEAYLHSRIVDHVRSRFIAALPLIVAIAVTALSLWTGWVFQQMPEGGMARGPLYIPVLAVTYGYALVATVRAISSGLKTANPASRRELFIMSTFAIPPAIVGVIDAFVPFLPIVAPAFLFSLFSIFTGLQEGQISHDPLTGLNNRRKGD